MRVRAVFVYLAKALALVAFIYATTYFVHRPFTAAPVAERFERVALRGVHQNFDARGVDNQTCTARRIETPTHRYLENTIESIAAAHDYGADRVEIDIHLSADGHLVVFHDWTLECRTDGTGDTRSKTLAELKALDIGYGYSADGSQSFPFRGDFVAALPSLSEVLVRLPHVALLVDQKDRSAATTRALAKLLEQHPGAVEQVCLMAVAKRTEQFRRLLPDACTVDTASTIKSCLLDYLARPWSRSVPDSCARRNLVIPDSPAAALLWGWPGTFVERMHSAGSKVFVISDDPQRAAALAARGFDGIWTRRIEAWSEADEAGAD